MNDLADPPQSDAAAARHTVFISYASADAGIAEPVCAALEAAGITCWIAPRDVRPGDAYAAAIVDAINGCRLMVIVLSKHAIESPHVLREVERASSKKRPLLSIRVDNTSLPAELEYFLSSHQWLDASGGPVERVYPSLIAAVRGRLGSSRPANARPEAPAAPARKGPGRASIVIAVALLALVPLYFAADRLWLHKRSEPAAGTATNAAVSGAPGTPGVVVEKSIAVLPFADMSEKHDQEYFSDGMAEEIIDLLVKVPELKVPARTSSFYFKGKATKIQDIARELGVANILEGSVRKSGDHLRVTAQLVRADNGFHLWSETYDRQLEDVFKTQDEIAGAVVKALKVSLLKADAPSAPLTSSSEAYELYLQARALAVQGDSDGTIKGYYDLQQAVALDPKFALAWAALAEMLAADNVDWTRVFSSNPPKPQTAEPDLSNWGTIWAQARAAAHAAADRATALAPNLAETHAAKAYVLAWLDWQWAAADVEYAKAIALAPTNARILRDAADIHLVLGRLTEGLDLANRAIALDPLGSAWVAIADAQFDSGNLDEAEKAARRWLETHATSDGSHYLLGNILLAKGDAQAALAAYEKSNGPQWRAVSVPLALDALGRRREADEILAPAEQKYGNGMAYQIACVYAGRRDLDRAFQWLDRAYKQHDGGLNSLKVDPMLKNLRQDSRYKALLLKMNLPA